jgi:hypothetical protein
VDNNNNLCDAHHDWGCCTGKRDVGQNHYPDSRSFGLYEHGKIILNINFIIIDKEKQEA